MFYLMWLLFAFLLAAVDSFLPFIPPVTVTVATVSFATGYPLPLVLLQGISIGLGTTFALYFYRVFGYKVLKLEKKSGFRKIELKVTEILDLLGYYPIILLQATAIGATVNYIFLFKESIDWKKYFVYTTIGRTMLLVLLFSLLNVKKYGNNIIYLIGFGYAILIIIVLYHLYISTKKIRKRQQEKKLEKNSQLD